MTDMNTQTTADLEAQAAAVNQELTVRKERDTAASHFKDSNGVRFTDPNAINDAMLRSMGVAMEARLAGMSWQEKTPDQLMDDLMSAARAQDYVAVGCYAGMLNAAKVLNK